MKNKELITVIIPVYNVEKYISKCIESVIEQTYTNIEIIIIDDGSTDGSGKICDRFAAEDARITAIHKENGGLSSARNTGLENLHGNWVTFLDSDDYLGKEAINELHKSVCINNSDISINNMIRVSSTGNADDYFVGNRSIDALIGEEKFSTLNYPSVCNKLFKASLFDHIEFPINKYYEDTFVYYRLCYLAQSISFTHYNGYYYCYRNGSITGRKFDPNRYIDFIEAVYNSAVFFSQKGLYDLSIDRCLSLYAAYSNFILRTSPDSLNQNIQSKAKTCYRFAYENSIKSKKINIKQKMRMVLLYFFPFIHKIIGIH